MTAKTRKRMTIVIVVLVVLMTIIGLSDLLFVL